MCGYIQAVALPLKMRGYAFCLSFLGLIFRVVYSLISNIFLLNYSFLSSHNSVLSPLFNLLLYIKYNNFSYLFPHVEFNPLSHLNSRLVLSPRVISSLVSSHLVLVVDLVRSLLLVLCRPVVSSCFTSQLFNLILYHRLPPRLVLSQTSSLGFVSSSTSSLISYLIFFTSSRLLSNFPASRFLFAFGFIFFISHPIFFTSSCLLSRRLSVLLALHHSSCLLIASRHGEEPLAFTPDLHRC